jgi:predicted amidohydrolase YtcJ
MADRRLYSAAVAERIVFSNGKVFTADAARSWVRAVAVEGERIVAVGHERDVADYLAGAEIIDLEGRLWPRASPTPTSIPTMEEPNS